MPSPRSAGLLSVTIVSFRLIPRGTVTRLLRLLIFSIINIPRYRVYKPPEQILGRLHNLVGRVSWLFVGSIVLVRILGKLVLGSFAFSQLRAQLKIVFATSSSAVGRLSWKKNKRNEGGVGSLALFAVVM